MPSPGQGSKLQGDPEMSMSRLSGRESEKLSLAEGWPQISGLSSGQSPKESIAFLSFLIVPSVLDK